MAPMAICKQTVDEKTCKQSGRFANLTLYACYGEPILL